MIDGEGEKESACVMGIPSCQLDYIWNQLKPMWLSTIVRDIF